jgi:hypothetical protein
VEIKTCRDTDPSQQETWAEKQHTELHEKLVEAGHRKENITQVQIMVGAAGTLYTDTKTALRSLGVGNAEADKALAAAHRTTCNFLRSIISLRRQLEPKMHYKRKTKGARTRGGWGGKA